MKRGVFTEFDAIPKRAFRVIVADPPWQYVARGEDGYAKSPQAHYGCMSAGELARLDVASIGQRESVLWLWAISSHLDQAVDLMRAWDYRFVTAGPWAKTTRTSRKWAFGTGHVLRGAAEMFLIGARGSPRPRTRSKRNLIVEGGPEDYLASIPDGEATFQALNDLMIVDRVREHSRKPDSVCRVLETVFAGPYIELFSRESRGPGWSAFGDEAGKFDGERRR
jgi:N6-adenosine-specific RNA methylase IME4